MYVIVQDRTERNTSRLFATITRIVRTHRKPRPASLGSLPRRSLTLALLCLCGGINPGCASGPDTSQPSWHADWQVAVDVPVAYRIQLESDSDGHRSARISLVLSQRDEGVLPSPLLLSLPNRWAGWDDLSLDIADLIIEDSEGRPLSHTRNRGRLEVAHDGTRQLRVHYQVLPRNHVLTAQSRFHAVSNADVLFGYGRNLLVVPRQVSERASVALELSCGTEDAWSSTLTPQWGRSLRLITTLGAAVDAAYLGGNLEVSSVSEGGSGAGLTIVSAANLDDRDLRRDIMIVTERTLAWIVGALGAPPIPSTVVVAMRRADEPRGATGSGRPGGLVLELGPEVPNTAELAELIAHESLHRYIGMALRFDEPSALTTLWFKEGVVSYLATRAVVESGVASNGYLLSRISDEVSAYLTVTRRGTGAIHPHGALARPESAEAFWSDPALQGSIYHEGYLLALWLDSRLQRNGSSLSEIIAEMLLTVDGPLTNASLRRVLEPAAGDLSEFFDVWVTGISPLPVEAMLAEAGFDIDERREDAPYYGVEARVNRWGEWRIVAVDPMGPAAGLSLTVGDLLTAAPRIPTHSLTARAIFEVRRPGGSEAVEVPAHRGARRRWDVLPR